MKAAALFLALLSTFAQAQIRVYIPISNEAHTWIQQQPAFPTGAPDFVALVIANMNVSYANSGSSTRVTSAGYSIGICCGVSPDHTSTILWLDNSLPIWSARDNANADIIIAVTDNVADRGVQGGLAVQCPNDASDAIGTMNVRDVFGYSFDHEIGHILCASHDKGYSGKIGNTLQNCEIWFTIMAQAPSNVMQGSCLGYEQTYNYPTTYTCSAQEWCTGFAAGFAFDSPAYYTGPTTGTLFPPGPNYQCEAKARRVQTGLMEVRTIAPMAAQTVNASFACPNVNRIQHYSNPLVSYKGQPTGTSTNNNFATIDGSQAILVQTFRNKKLAPALAARIVQAAQRLLRD